jgi:hypothetical protein
MPERKKLSHDAVSVTSSCSGGRVRRTGLALVHTGGTPTPAQPRQVSISPTFYEYLFCMKVLCKAFLYLHFGFVIFCRKNIIEKCVRKMLMKLTTGHFVKLPFDNFF